MKQSINIVLSGGGTGGHIYPAIAIADALGEKYPEASILFIGAKGRMEMEKVPAAGYPIKGLWISGIQRKQLRKNLTFPFKLISSLWKAFYLLRKYKPTVVIGTGGFASGPTLFVAAMLGHPTLIQEQNSYPGITNKLLAKKVDKVCVAYDHLERFFPAHKLVKTGNPVRQDLLSLGDKRKEAQTYFGLDPHKKTLLVIGGSLGAHAINKLLSDQLDWLLENQVQLLWQTGAHYYKAYKHYNDRVGVTTVDFLHRMDLAYAAADFIISRSGASAVSELCIVGKPVIFIPSPNVAEDHQTSNALSVVDKGAALLLKESELASFQALFSSLLHDEALQLKISKQLKVLALPDATRALVHEIEKLFVRCV